MKRDMDLIRRILFVMEGYEHGYAPKNFAIENYSEEEVGFHVWLMGDAGLLDVIDSTSHDSISPEAFPLRITWAGYEFLEAAREP